MDGIVAPNEKGHAFNNTVCIQGNPRSPQSLAANQGWPPRLKTRRRSRPNSGALRVPLILIGMALPVPSFCLKTGSTVFRRSDFQLVVVCETFASSRRWPLKSIVSDLSAYAPDSSTLAPGTAKVTQGSTSRPFASVKRPWKSETTRSCFGAGVFRPPRLLSSSIFPCTSSSVNRARLQREPSVQSQALGDVVPAWRQHECRPERQPADDRRSRRCDHHRHDVLDARLVHRDVERDRPAVLPLRRTEHGAGRVQVEARNQASITVSRVSPLVPSMSA